MRKSLIGIINIDVGNLRSVTNAVYSQGWDYQLVDDAAALDNVTHLIMPGVGSFRSAARRLDEKGLREPLRAFAASGRPMMGLCLGMQLLATIGEEGADALDGGAVASGAPGVTHGLDLVPGRVVRLQGDLVSAIPHVGWNGVQLERAHPVTEAIRSGADFYFVHSYWLSAASAQDVLGTTECGQEFVSAVARANVVGFQFHPEKSQANGLRLIANFCDWDGKC